MKLTVGLGSVDEYIRFSEAGADEFFCGYVPYSWTQKYDTMMPLYSAPMYSWVLSPSWKSWHP